MNFGLRERKKGARHAAFVAAARELVLVRGLDGVTVEDICEAVEVSPRTFFNYFATKEDAVLGLGVGHDPAALVSDVGAQFRAGGPTGTLLADLQALAAAVLADLVLGPARIGPVHELVVADPRLLGREVAWLEQGNRALVDIAAAREAVLPSGVDPGVTGAVLASLLRAVKNLWARDCCQHPPVTYLPTAVDQLRLLVAPSLAPTSP